MSTQIGIISDTHDNRPAIRKAVERFNRQGVGLVIHAGDLVAPFVAKDFGQLTCRLVGVFGNNDGECVGLRSAFSTFGDLYFGVHEFQHEGKRIVVMHEPSCIDALVDSKRFDVIIYGHTHHVDIREGETLVINPGEGGGWVHGRCTAVILNLDDRKAETVDL